MLIGEEGKGEERGWRGLPLAAKPTSFRNDSYSLSRRLFAPGWAKHRRREGVSCDYEKIIEPTCMIYLLRGSLL